MHERLSPKFFILPAAPLNFYYFGDVSNYIRWKQKSLIESLKWHIFIVCEYAGMFRLNDHVDHTIVCRVSRIRTIHTHTHTLYDILGAVMHTGKSFAFIRTKCAGCVFVSSAFGTCTCVRAPYWKLFTNTNNKLNHFYSIIKLCNEDVVVDVCACAPVPTASRDCCVQPDNIPV